MVSNPSAVDAVVLSSNRVFLLARKPVNRTRSSSIRRARSSRPSNSTSSARPADLRALLNRIITGSLDQGRDAQSDRHSDRLRQEPGRFDSSRRYCAAVHNVRSCRRFLSRLRKASRWARAEIGQTKDPVINMLVVEAEEQVMLKVTVAEVQRTAAEAVGRQPWRRCCSRAASRRHCLTENCASAICRCRGLALFRRSAWRPLPSGACAAGQMCVYNSGPGPSSVGNSGLISGWGNGNNRIQFSHTCTRTRRSDPDAGGTEPHRHFRRAGRISCRRRGPLRHRHRYAVRDELGRLQEIRCAAELHAGRPFGGPHQPQDRYQRQRDREFRFR